jgi:hypothetical protein
MNTHLIVSLIIGMIGMTMIAFATGQIVAAQKIYRRMSDEYHRYLKDNAPARRALSRRDLTVIRGEKR